MAKDVVQFLSTKLLQPNPFQPRNKIKSDDLEELIDSVKQHGIIEPLVVAETPAGYQIIAGERRWRAASNAGLDEVPVLIRKTTPRGMLELALIENVQRVDLSPIERGKAFAQLRRDFGFSTGEIAKRVGKSVSYVSNSLKLLDLPDAIKDGLEGNLISEGHARAIAGAMSTKAMIKIYKQILKEHGSVRRAEELVRLYKTNLEKQRLNEEESDSQPIQVDHKKVSLWQKSLRSLLGQKAKVKLSRSQKQTKITITLPGGLPETQSQLDKLMSLTSEF